MRQSHIIRVFFRNKIYEITSKRIKKNIVCIYNKNYKPTTSLATQGDKHGGSSSKQNKDKS